MPHPEQSPVFTMSPDGKPKPRNANHSPLMKQLRANLDGSVVNACPFGCTTDDLDQHGYCHHLIGFTLGTTPDGKDMVNDQNPPVVGTLYEPMVNEGGLRRIEVKRPKILLSIGGRKKDKAGDNFWKWGKPQYEKTLAGDVLVRVTTSWRVYRDVPKPVEEYDGEEVEIGEQPPPADRPRHREKTKPDHKQAVAASIDERL